MEPDVFYDRFIYNDFFERYVPLSFENICREFLIRKNKKGLVDPPIERIGKFYYDSPSEHKNGAFDIVTEDAKGYIFYEAKYKSQPVTMGMIEKEIQQVGKQICKVICSDFSQNPDIAVTSKKQI